jgi:hypothetical protein
LTGFDPFQTATDGGSMIVVFDATHFRKCNTTNFGDVERGVGRRDEFPPAIPAGDEKTSL